MSRKSRQRQPARKPAVQGSGAITVKLGPLHTVLLQLGEAPDEIVVTLQHQDAVSVTQQLLDVLDQLEDAFDLTEPVKGLISNEWKPPRCLTTSPPSLPTNA